MRVSKLMQAKIISCGNHYSKLNFERERSLKLNQYAIDLRAERQKVAELESMLKLVVGMCESIGSFSNGVTWQGIDEGDVMAQKRLLMMQEN